MELKKGKIECIIKDVDNRIYMCKGPNELLLNLPPTAQVFFACQVTIGYEPKQQHLSSSDQEVRWRELPTMGIQDGDVPERQRSMECRRRRYPNIRRQQRKVSKGPQCYSSAPGRLPANTRGTLEVSKASVDDAIKPEQHTRYVIEDVSQRKVQFIQI